MHRYSLKRTKSLKWELWKEQVESYETYLNFKIFFMGDENVQQNHLNNSTLGLVTFIHSFIWKKEITVIQ